MKNQPPLTANQFAIFAYFTLSQAARDWSLCLQGTMDKEFKKRLSALQYAERYLSSLFKSRFGEDMVTSYENEAAIWHEVMTILKSGSTEDKKRFVSFLKAFQDGDVKEVFPESENDQAA